MTLSRPTPNCGVSSQTTNSPKPCTALVQNTKNQIILHKRIHSWNHCGENLQPLVANGFTAVTQNRYLKKNWPSSYADTDGFMNKTLGNFNGTKKNLKAINQDKSNNSLTACFVETCCAPAHLLMRFNCHQQLVVVAFCSTQRQNRNICRRRWVNFGDTTSTSAKFICPTYAQQ